MSAVERGEDGREGAAAVDVAAPTIELENVTVFYGEVVGLSSVSLQIQPGITGIVGPNGSGKTTLMRVLTGLMAPGEGRARVLGAPPFTDERVRARVSFVPAVECFFENLSARRNLEIAFTARGLGRSASRDAAQRALETVGLVEPSGRRYATWSRGMRQRLKLGLALVGDAEVVLLDEPFLGVDPPTRANLRDLITDLAREERTILIASHVLHEVESLTDRVGILARGRLLGHGRVHDLLEELRDRHPHRVQLEANRARVLAETLIALPHIRELSVKDPSHIEFVTERPDLAYAELPKAIVQAGVVVRSVSTRDNTLEALFEHVTAAGARRL